jgi:hypothetical protein
MAHVGPHELGLDAQLGQLLLQRRARIGVAA